MELRDFFSEEEIRVMKERIIRETSLSHFLVDTEYVDSDGSKSKFKSLDPKIKQVIEQETVAQVKAYVREVVNTVAKERVAASIDNFSKRLCDQLEKIADKTNWYWSIK
jgi:hypothetical protein